MEYFHYLQLKIEDIEGFCCFLWKEWESLMRKINFNTPELLAQNYDEGNSIKFAFGEDTKLIYEKRQTLFYF